jgi:pyruvate/2-oxoglutarate dehydrogenase complex dihydrolipoamide acyltransferase (E2) component
VVNGVYGAVRESATGSWTKFSKRLNPVAVWPILGSMEYTPQATPDNSDEAIARDTAAADATQTSMPETLSPAVRRLIRQYDLDITAIHGTGPSGRIRVGDVIGMLGGRAAEAPPLKPIDRPHPVADYDDADELPEDTSTTSDADFNAAQAKPALAAAPTAISLPTTTVFDCDLSRVLSHRKRLRAQNVDVLLTSYFLVALGDAASIVAEITAGSAPIFDVRLAAADGGVHALRAAADETSASVDERLRAIDAQLRGGRGSESNSANMLVHHYGASGSLLATPTPIAAGHAGSVGIGRVRREVVVRTNDAGEESPRVSALCNVSLSFYAERIAFERANLLMATAIRSLEQWPD